MRNIAYKRKRTNDNIVVESYFKENNSSSKPPFVILTGMNVMPRSNLLDKEGAYSELEKSSYLGAFPFVLAKETNKNVFVVYQPGVCKNSRDKKIYSASTTLKQFNQATLLGEKVYLITHSLASVGALEILAGNLDYSDIKGKIIGMTISSPFTNAKDCYLYKGKDRELFGIKIIEIAKRTRELVDRFPFLSFLPQVHLGASQFWQDGNIETEKNKNWRLSRLFKAKSLGYILDYDGIKRAKDCRNNIPSQILITNEDKLCSPEKQREIGKNANIPTMEINSGHRWFTSEINILEKVVREINQHYCFIN